MSYIYYEALDEKSNSNSRKSGNLIPIENIYDQLDTCPVFEQAVRRIVVYAVTAIRPYRYGGNITLDYSAILKEKNWNDSWDSYLKISNEKIILIKRILTDIAIPELKARLFNEGIIEVSFVADLDTWNKVTYERFVGK